jgi:alpha-beta hydrolase superfamily lysophospholipase
MLNPKGEEIVKEKPYDKYSFENLAKRGGVASKIDIVGNKFYFKSEGRRISGEINISTGSAPVGVVVMARGYVEKEIYKTGLGTHNAAKYFSDHGYTTYAPDFSGYGESDPEDENALGARLVKPVEILDLIASVGATTDLPIYLWGHSNGGQIMISVAEILGERDPSLQGSSSQVKGVTLWAPVSKPFPYNILYYTDDASDSGKWLRGQISQFEETYDVFNYSIDRYFDWINMPIQIHQGSLDEAVPKVWSDNLSKALKVKEKTVNYYVYSGADHNMKPNWDSVVTRDLEFFASLNH